MDQSERYVDLDLDEAAMMRDGSHVLCAYRMRPVDHATRQDWHAGAAHFAAESSTGTNVEVATTDEHTRSVDAKVYHVDPDTELVKIAYPLGLFDRNITDGAYIMANVLTLTIGNNQGMSDMEHAKMEDIWFPPAMLAHFDGPSTTLADLWRVLGRPETDGGLIVGTIVKPKLGLQPEPFAAACEAFWQGGDFIKNDEPQGNQPFAPMQETIPLVAAALDRAQQATGEPKLFSANITADDPWEIVARGEFVLSAFGEHADHVALLVDGYVAGPTAVTTLRRRFPDNFLHYHRAGHGAVTSPRSSRGYTAFVLAKLARILGASGMHTGTMGFGKMEGDLADRLIPLALQTDHSEGPHFAQDWGGMAFCSPILSGGLNPLRLPGMFGHLGHANVIMTAGGGAYGHVDGPAEGARALRRAYEAWRDGEDLVAAAASSRPLARAFESFSADADRLHPGWRERLLA